MVSLWQITNIGNLESERKDDNLWYECVDHISVIATWPRGLGIQNPRLMGYLR